MKIRKVATWLFTDVFCFENMPIFCGFATRPCAKKNRPREAPQARWMVVERFASVAFSRVNIYIDVDNQDDSLGKWSALMVGKQHIYVSWLQKVHPDVGSSMPMLLSCFPMWKFPKMGMTPNHPSWTTLVLTFMVTWGSPISRIFQEPRMSSLNQMMSWIHTFRCATFKIKSNRLLFESRFRSVIDSIWFNSARKEKARIVSLKSPVEKKYCLYRQIKICIRNHLSIWSSTTHIYNLNS